MHFHAVMAVLLLTILVGCGDDVARKQKSRNAGTERTTPGINTETGLLASHMHRLRGIDPLSAVEEITQITAGNLAAAYRPVPDLEIDDEGSSKNIITMSKIGRPGVTCGTGATFAGIDARIADCKTKNGKQALWSGHLHGAAGESTWQLVALTGARKEIWTDVRTGMVWSDIMATNNWCKASGNKQEAGNCTVLGEDDSICFDSNLQGFGTNIKWRLPTRNDYLQADINGLRFVLKPSASAVGAWTATVEAAAADRNRAWVYHVSNGTLTAQEFSSQQHVRCIGAAVR